MGGQAFFAETKDAYHFKFTGCFRFTLCPAVDAFIRRLIAEQSLKPVVIDLTEAAGIDSTGMGVLAQLAVHCKRMLQRKPSLLVRDNDILKVLRAVDFETVFDIAVDPHNTAPGADYGEIQTVAVDHQQMARQILDAHRRLMSMTEKNRATYEEAVRALEKKV